MGFLGLRCLAHRYRGTGCLVRQRCCSLDWTFQPWEATPCWTSSRSTTSRRKSLDTYGRNGGLGGLQNVSAPPVRRAVLPLLTWPLSPLAQMGWSTHRDQMKDKWSVGKNGARTGQERGLTKLELDTMMSRMNSFNGYSRQWEWTTPTSVCTGLIIRCWRFITFAFTTLVRDVIMWARRPADSLPDAGGALSSLSASTGRDSAPVSD